MKALFGPTCGRCGYTYRPKGKSVLIFENADGKYAACQTCIEELGDLKEKRKPKKVIDDFINSFKIQ